MFILDSLMIAGLRWVLDTTRTAAEAEMNDDSALREQLLEAEMRREMGEISDEDFAALEADILARIREIKERREGTGALALGNQPMEAAPGSTFQVEAEVSGDFHEHDRTQAPAATVDRSDATAGSFHAGAGRQATRARRRAGTGTATRARRAGAGQVRPGSSRPARARSGTKTGGVRGTRAPRTKA